MTDPIIYMPATPVTTLSLALPENDDSAGVSSVSHTPDTTPPSIALTLEERKVILAEKFNFGWVKRMPLDMVREFHKHLDYGSRVAELLHKHTFILSRGYQTGLVSVFTGTQLLKIFQEGFVNKLTYLTSRNKRYIKPEIVNMFPERDAIIYISHQGREIVWTGPRHPVLNAIKGATQCTSSHSLVVANNIRTAVAYLTEVVTQTPEFNNLLRRTAWHLISAIIIFKETVIADRIKKERLREEKREEKAKEIARQKAERLAAKKLARLVAANAVKATKLAAASAAKAAKAAKTIRIALLKDIMAEARAMTTRRKIIAKASDKAALQATKQATVQAKAQAKAQLDAAKDAAKQAKEVAKQEAKQAKEVAKQEAKKAKEEAKQEAKQAKEVAKQEAKKAKEEAKKAKEEAKQEAKKAKEEAKH